MRIFLELVNWRVKPNKITILSQYRAQCSAIEKQLEGFGYAHPNVGTVIASQGTLSVFFCIIALVSLLRVVHCNNVFLIFEM